MGLVDVDTAKVQGDMDIPGSVSQLINPVLGVMVVEFANGVVAQVKDSGRNEKQEKGAGFEF